VVQQRVERKLAAILAADVAGFSRLVGIDEEGTLAALKAVRRTLIDPKIDEYRGRIVKTTGDGLLVEFASVVDALRCAVDVQRRMYDRNADTPDDKRIEFRIGLNVGDVVIDAGDIHGDGVNIAARLEAISEPGGICVSLAARDQVGDRLEVVFEDAGEQQLKNIARPVRVYRVRLDRDDSRVPHALGIGDKPSVAVLPFQNMSGDPGQQYFSDGITEDIIDRLSKYRILSVIGCDSSFALRGRDGEMREIRDRLRADYVLTGSIRKSADRVRIAARLTDARTGSAMWADHYDRPLQDIFAVQDEVANIIASTLLGRVEIQVATRNATATPAGVSSYEYVLEGMWHFRKLSPAANAVAANCFTKAITADPTNAEAHRWLSGCHLNGWFLDFSKEDLAVSLRLAARAIELDPASATCHTAYAYAQLMAEGAEAAERSYLKAFSLNPGDPAVLVEMGLLNAYLGKSAAAQAFFDQAFRLNPLPPLWYGDMRGVAQFVDGRYADALPSFAAIPDTAWDTMYAMACLGHLGEREQAIKCQSRFREAGRNWNLMAGAEAEPFRDPEPRRRLLAGLDRALKF
jgi:TolB-like protein/class 3 adenylate cyclase